MRVSRITIVAIYIYFSISLLQAQQPVNLQGFWELVTQKINGKDNQLYGRQIKLLSRTHFVWVRQNKDLVEKLLAKGTVQDSLAAYHDAFGAGSYTVIGTTYTETSEFFYEPKYIGTSIDFTFKLYGDRWYTSGHFTGYDKGNKIDEFIEEEWKRAE